MTPIRIENVSKKFGTATAVSGITLEIPAGELFFLLGPSGCGKTTLLRMLAGFVQPDSGDLFFGDQRITPLPPRARDASMVFQNYALWPHMTVAKNVAYGLQVRGTPKAELARRVEQVLKMVHMENLGERKPNQLSGGQQQRVALARALAVQPRVLLLDEPLSNLDARLRDELREEIRRLHDETGLTMVYVTHDQKEALALANRLAVMESGRLMQVGTPDDVYNRPANRFVAGFLGESNFLPGKVKRINAGRIEIETAVGSLVGTSTRWIPKEGEAAVCSIRPHAWTIGSAQDSVSTTVNRIPARIQHTAFLGELHHLRVLAGNNLPLTAVCLPHQAAAWKAGDAITLSVGAEQVVVLPNHTV